MARQSTTAKSAATGPSEQVVSEHVVKQSVRERLIDAALSLFDERGYEVTTVDDIVERAGVGRTTFFRNFRSKDEVIFPDHDHLMEAITRRLATSSNSTAIVAVSDVVRLVLIKYIEEGDRARRRYQLTSRVSALRDREIASVAQYQRLFREFIASWMGTSEWTGSSEETALRAELMAASVVAAHNHVLRRWLRGESPDPLAEVDVAMAKVIQLFSTRTEPDIGTTVVVVRTTEDADTTARVIREALARRD